MATPDFFYQERFPLGNDQTEYYLLTREFVSVAKFEGEEIVKVDPEGLAVLAKAAMHDTSFMLRTEHIKQIAAILEDPEASKNDKFVALVILRNAEISAKGILPICQDTGTATVFAKKGQKVWTGGNDYESISRGIYKTYTQESLRYSQTVALDMYTEKNSGTNLPAQVDIYATKGNEYEFLFVAKGGGSANKSMLFQETKALLTPEKLEAYLM